MNSGATAERVYDVLKRRIMDHEFRPGERLDPAALADTLASSVTPVRDALHVLTGEGLVETRTSDGFHLPHIDEPALKDLYAWNGDVLVYAIRAWPKACGGMMEDTKTVEPIPVLDAVGDLFARIAGRSANAEHARAIASLNARLQAARTVEMHIFNDIRLDFSAIGDAFEIDDRHTLRRLIMLFHRRRQKAAAVIVRALYRIG